MEEGAFMKAEIIYYSATGTTRKLIKSFAEGLGLETVFTDITLPVERETYHPIESDLLVLATPIYGERIPRFIMDYFNRVKGGGRPLAVLSVYGNMGFGISLSQFEDYAQKNHFRLIAAGTFIGEHTYAGSKIPVALGRPDMNDLRQAFEFGERVKEKLTAGGFGPVMLPKAALPKFITEFPDTGTRFLIRQPAVDPAVCNHCGFCVRKCPVGAIDPATLRIDEGKCIRCYACVKGCPKSARAAKFRLKVFGLIFGALGRKRKENQFYI